MDPLRELVRAVAREVIAELLPHLHGGDDELLTLDAAGAIVGKRPRAIRDAGRRGDLELVGVGRSPRVRRSVLLAWARPLAPTLTPPDDPRADARASIAAAAARVSGGGR